MTHKEVPTRNYRSVHITGNVSLLIAPEALIDILSKQTADFEAAQQNSWSFNDAPVGYIQAMCRAIVGIRIDITDVQAQFKLRQNKTVDNKVRFVAGLKEFRTARANEMAVLIENVN